MFNVTKSGFAINDRDKSLYDLLEKALTDDSSNLLSLQGAYYHPDGNSAWNIRLSATVTFVDIKNVLPGNYIHCPMLVTCDNESNSCSNYFRFMLSLYSNNDDGPQQISDLIGLDGYDTFKIFDPSFSYVMGALAVPEFLDALFGNKVDNEIEFSFLISELNWMPNYGQICDNVSMLLV